MFSDVINFFFNWVIRKVKAKIQTWLARDKAGNQLRSPREEWTATGAGCYHNLLVSYRTRHRRLWDGGQMSSGCFVNVDNMRLLLLCVYKWSTRPNNELEHWRHLRCCLLLIHCAGWCYTEIVETVKVDQCKSSSFIYCMYLYQAETLKKKKDEMAEFSSKIIPTICNLDVNNLQVTLEDFYFLT